MVVSMTAAAQPQPEERLEVEREVVVTGEAGERPAVVYGAANIGVQIVFDAPLHRTDAGTALLVLPDADVRLHPYLKSSLFLTPSMALASGPTVPLHVALVDGGVPLLLTFQPGKVDHVLRILQRPLRHDAGTAVSKAFQETLSSMAGVVFKDGTCAPLQSQLVRANPVPQTEGSSESDNIPLVCAAGMVNYIRVLRAKPGCAASSARLFRKGTGVETEVLLVESAQAEKGGTWQVLAAWSPPEVADFELLLLAKDGTVCERHGWLSLWPGDSL
jgi:hypothetical protein